MTPWTCPFCSLLCDRFALDGSLQLRGSDCPRATRALAHFKPDDKTAQPSIAGEPASLDDAIAAAAHLLAQSRQPLFGGLATDIAGARSLYALANTCHAILDHANSAGLMPGLRTLQDRGLLQTTLAEIRNRADLMVVIGTQPSRDYPEFYRRCGVGDPVSQLREIVFLGAAIDPSAAGIDTRSVAWSGDAYTTLATLNAVAGKRKIDASPELRDLVQKTFAAKYVVFVWEPGRLPGEHAALLVESINQLAKTVNRTTRAGGLALAGNEGGLAVSQALGWMSGLPVRTGVHASGLLHEPHRYASDRLLADRAVDALLWVASFGPDHTPPAAENVRAGLPTIVLAHPSCHPGRSEGSRASAGRDSSPRIKSGAGASARNDNVFIPVSTPGIGSSGHLFRLDGVVVVPLTKARDDGLPTVAQVIDRIDAQMKRTRAEAA